MVRIIAVFIAIIAIGHAANADDNFGTIRGTVTLSGIHSYLNGAPVCGLNVFLRSPSQWELHTRTARDGLVKRSVMRMRAKTQHSRSKASDESSLELHIPPRGLANANRVLLVRR
jgi:hypothetical protein